MIFTEPWLCEDGKEEGSKSGVSTALEGLLDSLSSVSKRTAESISANVAWSGKCLVRCFERVLIHETWDILGACYIMTTCLIVYNIMNSIMSLHVDEKWDSINGHRQCFLAVFKWLSDSFQFFVG